MVCVTRLRLPQSGLSGAVDRRFSLADVFLGNPSGCLSYRQQRSSPQRKIFRSVPIVPASRRKAFSLQEINFSPEKQAPGYGNGIAPARLAQPAE